MFCLQVGVAHAKYKNCGHKKSLTPEQATQVVDFVKHWRANYNRSAKGKRRAKNYNRSAKGKRRAKRWNDKRYSLRHES